MKVAIAFGTRPEVIKIAPVYIELSKRKNIHPVLIATAQHREMMDMMLKVFKITPDYDLNIMTKGQTPNTVASKVFMNMEEVLNEIKPDILLVQGDTTTAMTSAISAFHIGIKVGHIEAGLRSGNLYDPFPEEMNRRVIGVVSDYNFAPTKRAYENLINEGINEERIYVTGNTVVDALHYIKKNFELSEIRKKFVEERDYILVTLHRRENWGEKMKSILKGLRRFSNEENLKIVFPVHKNPKVREVVNEILGDFKNALLLEPVNYVEFLSLLDGCSFVLTDSGGIQEEAPSFHKFVVVARNTTERPELIENGAGILAGTDEEKVYNALKSALVRSNEVNVKNPFGDGKASVRIADIIEKGEYVEFKG